VPASALEAYEALRTAAVEERPCLAGLATLRFHGLLEGLPRLAKKEGATRTAVSRQDPVVDPPPDDAFVRLLANLVLSTHAEELTHAY
jgi:hypothetical protein